MGAKMIFRWAWVALLLVAFSLGCKLTSGISEAVAVATQMDLGGMATEFDMGALATDFDLESLATEMAGYATEFDPGVIETQMGAMTTQMEALSTEIDFGQMMTQIPAIQGTLVAFATPPGFPADIPLLAGEQRLIMGGSADQLQYAVGGTLPEAVEFYRREMAARGWSEAPNSRVTDRAAVLVFQQGNRTANVTIAEDLFFGVIISIKLEG
jgi:hypothetical protein